MAPDLHQPRCGPDRPGGRLFKPQPFDCDDAEALRDHTAGIPHNYQMRSDWQTFRAVRDQNEDVAKLVPCLLTKTTVLLPNLETSRHQHSQLRTTAVASISTRAAGQTRRTTCTSAMLG